MVAVGQLVIERVDDVDRAVGVVGAADEDLLVVRVTVAVPAWLAEAADRAHRGGRRLAVELDPATERTGDAAVGWEIGAITAALAAGADEVLGAAPQRVARVREVLGRLAGAAEPEPEAGEAR